MSATIIPFPKAALSRRSGSPLLDRLALKGVYPCGYPDEFEDAYRLLLRGRRAGIDTEDWSFSELLSEVQSYRARESGPATRGQMTQAQMDRTVGMAIAFLHGPSKTGLDKCINAWRADLDRRGL